jgi:hypothetical protein
MSSTPDRFSKEIALARFYAFFIGKLHRLLGEWLDSIIDNGQDDEEEMN